MGLLGHVVVLFLVFQGPSILFSIVAISIYIPSNNVGGFLFPHTLPVLINHRFVDDDHSEHHQMAILIHHCSFDFRSLVISDVEHLFTCLLATHMSSLEECPFRSSAHFLLLMGLFVVLILSYMSSLYFLAINPLSVASSANVFSVLMVVFLFCLWFPLLCKSFLV